ncbi:hypothetical protein BGZ50_001806 [Haplosporangium sp. Z 11]|nr:hypothetical protein BGZ50_001806 [Haplosporangium sp. Z 11]
MTTVQRRASTRIASSRTGKAGTTDQKPDKTTPSSDPQIRSKSKPESLQRTLRNSRNRAVATIVIEVVNDTISKTAKEVDTKKDEAKNAKDIQGAEDSKDTKNAKDTEDVKDIEGVKDTEDAKDIEDTKTVINASTSQQQTATKSQVGASRKRKWARPTRIVKLEDDDEEGEHEVEGVEDSDQENKDDASDDDSEVRQNDTDRPSKYKRTKDEPELSEYERQRLENIKRNEEMLQFLQLPTAAMELKVFAKDSSISTEKTAPGSTPAPIRIKRPYVKRATKILTPVRTSNRIRGITLMPQEIGEDDRPVQGAQDQQQQQQQDNADNEDENEDTGNLMSGDLFFDKETREKAIRVDGQYKGWLNEEVMAKYGFEKSAQDAWEANGGGTFSFRDPLGEGSSSVSSSKSSRRPKHDAKMVAKALFKKNPNAFFYRHNEPGQEQWTGDWTEPERELFLKVAKEHGCGDKWGLFASHIPHRVGYQCSNFYRQVVLPEGLVFDPNYEYTSRGRPIYCGKYNQRRN